MNKIKNYFSIKNLLYLFILSCPILDIISFIFRNTFETNISITTFLRPIIPVILFLMIFIKENKKNKIIIVGVISAYIIYSIVHLSLYSQLIKTISYSGILHEAQYLINYTFIIMLLYTAFKVLYKNENKELKYVIVLTMAIYVVSIYISIITKTSSTSYIEGLGYKGWFESANSISSILVILLTLAFSQINNFNNLKTKIVVILTILLTIIYLTVFIGTRVGLYGSIFVVGIYIFLEIFYGIIKQKKLKIKYIFAFIIIVTFLVSFIFIFGSNTFKRRNHLKNIESNIIDETTNEMSHVTGDISTLRKKIILNEIDNSYMSESQKKSILDLYDYANKIKLANNDIRMQQLIYNVCLVKNQNNILLIMFGNGYLVNTNELVLEMEIPAILFNFGIIGFILYILPFLIIFFHSIKNIVTSFKKSDVEILMLFAADGFAFSFSTLAGYTFFNISSASIIIISNILLLNKICKIRGDKD